MLAIVVLLIVGALGAAFVGVMLLTPVTYGVGFIGLACFAGILARLIQAQEHDYSDRQSRDRSSSFNSSSTSTS